VQQVCFTPDDRFLFTWEKAGVRVWDAATGKATCALLPLETAFYKSPILFNPTGSRALTMHLALERSGVLWDLRTGRPLCKVSLAEMQAIPEFSADGRLLAVSGRKPTVWDAMHGRPITALPSNGALTFAVSFRADGRRVVTAGGDGTARVWDVQTGRSMSAPMLHSRTVLQAQFSPDGQLIVTLCDDGHIRLWDAATGELISILADGGNQDSQMEFVHNGESLLVTGARELKLISLVRKPPPIDKIFPYAQLLSGQSMDPVVGRVTAAPGKLRGYWQQLHAHSQATLTAQKQFSP
jgi:WD40 repeat protein